jgi:hypothetical protein
MPKAIVAVKPASSASGASGVTRYIAESKRDPEKEQLKDGEARPLFSSNFDHLDYHEANTIIGESVGDKAQADEVAHLIISLEPEQFEALGDNVDERKEAFKEIIREAAKAIENEVQADKLNWVAGIHLNTDNPHAHIAISRDVLDSESGDPKRLNHLPRTLLPHHETDANGKNVLQPGVIAETVTLHLNHAIDHRRDTKTLEQSAQRQPEHTQELTTDSRSAQQPEPPRDRSPTHQQQTVKDKRTEPPQSPPAPRDQQSPASRTPVSKEEGDRLVLGRAMIVAAEVERLDRELNSLIEHGDKRRFRVFDASHDRTRPISQFDVHRRADTRAGAAVRAQEITDPNERHTVRVQLYNAELAAHDKAIRDHGIVVKRVIEKTSKDLAKAEEEHAGLQAQVRAIVREYAPQRLVPLLNRDELSKLQNQAISNNNPNRIKTLERIRESLAAEHNAPTRNDKEVARLEGQLLLARAEQAASAARLNQFEQTRHQTNWQITSEKYSLVYVNRQIEEKGNASRVFGGGFSGLNLFPSARRAAAAAVTQFQEVREIIFQKIEDRRTELTNSLNDSLKMTEALTTIFTTERDKQQSRMGERLEKDLTRNEISRLVDHSLALCDPAMLRQALLLESQYNDRQQQPLSVAEQSSKASGREILGDIALNEATARLETFQERKDFVPVMVTDLQGQDITTRLFDYREPLHPFKWLVQRMTETKNDRHLRNAVTEKLELQEDQLKADVQNATQCQELLSLDADRLRGEMKAAGHEPPDATFTTKQIMQLEIYAHRQQDPNERDRILNLITNAEQSHHVFTPQKFDNEKTVAEVLAKDDPTLQQPDPTSTHDQVSPTMTATNLDRDPLRATDPTSPGHDEPDLDLTH